jgi:hypothetical protein
MAKDRDSDRDKESDMAMDMDMDMPSPDNFAHLSRIRLSVKPKLTSKYSFPITNQCLCKCRLFAAMAISDGDKQTAKDAV